MKGYKAFRKGMICAPDEQHKKQYAENTVFEEDSAEVCKKGMHFCKDPLAVLNYYPLVDENGEMSEFAEVEALDECKTDDGQKYCTKKLKVGAKLSFPALVQASVEFEKSTEINASEDEDEKISSKGDSARIGSSGDWTQIGSSGYRAQIGSSGDSARIGSSGYRARIGSSGDSARIGSSGYRAQIGSSGDSARIGSSGDSARIGSSGDSARIASSGKHSVICCAGNESIVKAKKGSWITLAEWQYDKVECAFIPVCVKTEYVDGEKIKADTPYKLVNGKFEEVKG